MGWPKQALTIPDVRTEYLETLDERLGVEGQDDKGVPSFGHLRKAVPQPNESQKTSPCVHNPGKDNSS